MQLSTPLITLAQKREARRQKALRIAEVFAMTVIAFGVGFFFGSLS